MASGSGLSYTAGPYNENFEDFQTKVVKFWKKECKGKFPNLDQSSLWKVYLLSKTIFGHYSLMSRSASMSCN